MPVEDGHSPIGELWGLVVDRQSWSITHIVVEPGRRLKSSGILVSREALSFLDRRKGILGVSIVSGEANRGEEGDVSAMLESPHVTRLKVSMEPEDDWALPRPAPLPAFPLPVVSSFYVAEGALQAWDGPPPESRPKTCRDLIGCSVQGIDGTVGVVDDLLLDDDGWAIRYAVVDTGRWFPGRKAILPTLWLKHSREEMESLQVDLRVEDVKAGPSFDRGQSMTPDTEREIFRHYDRKPYWT